MASQAGAGAPLRTFLITHDIVNCFRYLKAVTDLGTRVLRKVFEWTYQGGTLLVKDYFLSLGHSNTDYRGKFTRDQRDKLDRGCTADYDITLLYSLLKEVCGLAADANTWNTPSQALEHFIYKLKCERNNVSHTLKLTGLSDQELQPMITDLENLLRQVLLAAGTHCNRPGNEIQNLIDEINDDFQDLLVEVREPLSASSLSHLPSLQLEIQVFKDVLKNQLLTEGQQELYRLYPNIWDVSLAQWLYQNLSIRPSLNFTSLVIKEETWTFPSFQQEQPRFLPHQDLLEVRRRDGHLPEVLILAGNGGIGKTTLLKYLLEKWVTDPSQIKGLDTVPLLMYFELRVSTIETWKDMVKTLLQDTYNGSSVTDDFFCDLIMSTSPVILLDGYDEANQESKNLVKSLLDLRSNVRLVITTRMSGLEELSMITRAKKREMIVEIKGLKKDQRPEIVKNTLAQIIPDQQERDQLEVRILHDMTNLTNDSNEYDVPLMVILVVLRGLEVRTQPDTNDIYHDLTELMKGKAKERLTGMGIVDPCEQIENYFYFFQKMSFACLKRNEFDLLPSTVSELKTFCDRVGLPWKEMLSAFLTSKKCKQRISIIDIWSFPHKSFHEYWASGFIVQEIQSLTPHPVFTDQHDEATNMYQNNAIMKVYASNVEEVNNLSLKESSGSKLLLDVVNSVTKQLHTSMPSMLGPLKRDIVSVVLYSGCKQTDDEGIYCDDLCRCLEAADCSPHILDEISSQLQSFRSLVSNLVSPQGLKQLFNVVNHQALIIEPHWLYEFHTVDVIGCLPPSITALNVQGDDSVIDALIDQLPILSSLQSLGVRLYTKEPRKITGLAYSGDLTLCFPSSVGFLVNQEPFSDVVQALVSRFLSQSQPGQINQELITAVGHLFSAFVGLDIPNPEFLVPVIMAQLASLQLPTDPDNDEGPLARSSKYLSSMKFMLSNPLWAIILPQGAGNLEEISKILELTAELISMPPATHHNAGTMIPSNASFTIEQIILGRQVLTWELISCLPPNQLTLWCQVMDKTWPLFKNLQTANNSYPNWLKRISDSIHQLGTTHRAGLTTTIQLYSWSGAEGRWFAEDLTSRGAEVVLQPNIGVLKQAFTVRFPANM